jgi:XTP/dITP diphosphohydrolase
MMRTFKIVLGTNNRHKVTEIREVLARSEALKNLGARVEIAPLSEFPAAPEVVEDRDTFEGNAVKKACTLAKALGMPVVADDSGLQVDALGGRPGVMSARYSGVHGNYEANNRKVLREMAKVPAQKRTARFVTVVAFAKPEGLVFTTEGKIEGRITAEPRGTNGFGYDPIFLLPERGVTMAELTLAEKNAISHRARAIKAFCEKLAQYLKSAAKGV